MASGDDPVSVYERTHAPGLSPFAFSCAVDRRVVASGDIDGAGADALVTAVRRFPWSRRLREGLWRRIVRVGRYDLVPELHAAATASGAGLSAHLCVHDGERRYAAGDVAGAAAQFQAAVTDDPSCAEAWNDLGVALHALGRPEALDALAIGIRVGGAAGSDCIVNRAVILAALGRLAEARRDATAGLAAGRTDVELHEVMAATTGTLAPLTFDARMRLAA